MLNTPRRRLLAALVALPLSVPAQGTPPTKPVRLVVPFPPGGNVDLSARILAPELSRELGQPVVVENKAGAGGTLGLDAVAKSAPDGSTIGIASPVNHLAAPSLYPRLPYDSVKDFTPVGLIASVPMVLVVGSSSPAKSVAELLALARSRKGTMTMASAGSGSGNHIVGELFQDATGTQLVHVPYKGSAPANTDLAGGHVDLHFDQLSSVLPLLQGGKLRALAVTTAGRSPLLPEVPTLAEAGVARFDAATTLGLVLPGKAAPDLVARLNQALDRVLRQPAVKEQFARLGAEVRPGTPAEYAEFIRSEIARTAKIVRDARITLD
ncbi:Bug family tripartite tricarboxylate transporter substrate binding protein [Aquabacterium sp. J223]|uniref:Bug family tripartite tricarboxylate transporter substrate binding protein n=1 Tax=Aquabacterium sp. J223 TaxID=2898431 RepID=UPI0021AD9AA8|nr:tripartite tricarboxylate transporter substrate binding protein [Aquabacterium sp. J223]UUX93983.1 tripartite tricarboxylate transporter substrate binding protein [Aquabacterium sp. J223]